MIQLLSFGYKTTGEPAFCKTIVDLRAMRNPHKLASLRDLTGRDAAVQNYVESDPKFEPNITALLRDVRDGDRLAAGCFGGRHRSVAMIEIAARRLKARGFNVQVSHMALEQTAVSK